MNDHELLAEIEATLALVRTARENLLSEPERKTARGGSVASPWLPTLRDASSYLVRLTALADRRKLKVPIPDDELNKLLAG